MDSQMSKKKQGPGEKADLKYSQSTPTTPSGFAEDHDSLPAGTKVASAPYSSEADLNKLIESLDKTVKSAVDEHLAAGRTVYGIDPDNRITGTRR